MTPETAVQALMARAGLPQDATLGVALSGGGDSMALLHLLAGTGQRLSAVTIDHGLRDVAGELALCARAAADLGVPHEVRRWHWGGQGNLQAAAREGRRAAIRDWATARGIAHVALGHTEDDQAETVLLRLARGSGIDGLAAMAPFRDENGITWLRPLLDLSRADLRAWLHAQGIAWAEDPSNEAPRFDRVRARNLMDTLADLGLTRGRLAQLADHARAAQVVLDAAARDWAAGALREDRGDIILPGGVPDLGADSPRRVLSAAVRWIGSAAYRPRWKALRTALEAAAGGQPRTVAGCLIRPERGALRLTREAACCGASVAAGHVWDGRWQVIPPKGASVEGLRIAALGAEGLALCPDWRQAGLPRATLLASPAIWRDDTLISAPLARYGPDWQAMVTSHFQFSAFTLNRSA